MDIEILRAKADVVMLWLMGESDERGGMR